MIDLEDNCGLQMKSKPASIGESSGDAADNASQNPRASDNQGSPEENAELVPQAANLALNGGRKHADSLEKDEFEPKHRKLEKESHSDATDDAPRDPGPCDNQDSSKKDTEKKKGIIVETADFKKLSGYEYYVDKTSVIEKIFSGWNHSIIITVPRRSGKSTMISSVKYFAQIQVDEKGNVLSVILSKKGNEALITDTENYKLFEKRKVSGSKETMKHLGKYPVIHLNLGGSSNIATMSDLVSEFRESIQNAYLEHEYLVHSPELSEDERNYVEDWCSASKYEKYNQIHVQRALKKLSRFLHKHFKQNSLVLIDEYDSVMINILRSKRLDHKAIKDMQKFISSVFVSLLKGNPNVARALVTGISYIAGNWSDWNNRLPPYRFLEAHEYNSFFGLTQPEIEDLFSTSELVDKKKAVEKAYSGYYTHDNQPIYNIFSVMCYLITKKLKCYWEMSGAVLGMLESIRDPKMRWKMEKLLNDESVEISIIGSIPVSHLLNLSDCLNHRSTNPFDDAMVDLVLQFLLEQGYLTIVPELIDPKQGSVPTQKVEVETDPEQQSDSMRMNKIKVKIPNRTIMDEFNINLTTFYRNFGSSKQEQREKCSESMKQVFDSLGRDNNDPCDELKTYFNDLKTFYDALYKRSLKESELRTLFVCSLLVSCTYHGLEIAVKKAFVTNARKYYYTDYAGVFECNGQGIGFVCEFKVNRSATAAATQLFDRGYQNVAKDSPHFKRVTKVLVLAIDLSEKKKKGMRFDVKYAVVSRSEIDRLTLTSMKSIEV